MGYWNYIIALFDEKRTFLFLCHWTKEVKKR